MRNDQRSLSLYLSIYLSIYLSLCVRACVCASERACVFRWVYVYVYVYVYVCACCIKSAATRHERALDGLNSLSLVDTRDEERGSEQAPVL